MQGAISKAVVGLAVAVAASACGPTRAPAQPAGGAEAAQASQTGPPSGVEQPAPNAADVHFMSGMIPHHAQAVLIAGWAASHGARSDVRILCERIVVGQRDEIALMQMWLSDRGLPVPDAKATHHRMVMNGMEHDMLMPGMLTDEELAALDKARGPEWDRLFLTAMIKHHEGAIAMVDELFASYGAAQGETVFKFASDVYADQTIEIDRMYKMLAGKNTPASLDGVTR
jgi:uncharacterized protein (DUF305 family)